MSGKYTVARFTAGLDPVERSALLDALSSGYQLRASAVRGALAPCVVMLAAYARCMLEIELVDDYDALLEAQQQAMRDYCKHPDLFFASCVVLLHARGQEPEAASFRSIGLDELFEELVHTEE